MTKRMWAPLRRAMAWLPTILALGLALGNAPALAAPITYCVFDPLGAQGDYFAMARDYQLAAKRWSMDINLKSYSSETIAVEDFKAGQCDMINVTGLRARLFNQFSGTIDAPGAVEDYPEMRSVISLMASPKLANYMVSGQFEVAGIMPLGAAYTFVNDRSMNTIAKFAGKKIAVMGWDKTESIMAEQFGAQPVLSDITDMGGKFNNGAVDVLIAPAVLYKPFELYKGLGEKGGIIRRAVLQLTMQLIIRRDKFPANYGQQSREYAAGVADHAFGVIRNDENEIESRHWLYMSRAERGEYYATVRSARTRLSKEGFYDKRMLNILKRIRCRTYPDDSECSEGEE